MTTETRSCDVVIVGAGAAGIGFGVTLRHLEFDNFVILDREAVGASFLRWPRQMRFITPSFNSNQFGTLDLNAVCLDTSPAYSLGVEHPTGREYAKYLEGVSSYFELPVMTGTDVLSVEKNTLPYRFRLKTSRGDFLARFVVWAGGEMQYPKINGLPGAEHCLHNSKVKSWKDLNGAERCIIGGGESGIDAAIELANADHRVIVFDREEPWNETGSDPSRLLSPFTHLRLQKALNSERVALYGNCTVKSVNRNDRNYQLTLDDGAVVDCAEQPILASGFVGSASLIESLFTWRDDGFPVLTENDESEKTKGLFLIGPQVCQDDLIFCFIYKFRQRFAVVANQIAKHLRLDTEPLEWYRQNGMYLEDLSCCGDACAC
ncbi:MAG: NAD(P)-binding domain-containing protein [Bacteroidetes bacterium]|nr:NAD(P)-binding domain-containing protein [Bacteroidota bacterium]MCY4233844.1 NAD(P)-binding domain-containing protein [Bacteroidota bacterium]